MERSDAALFIWEFLHELAVDLRRGLEPALRAAGLVSALQVVMLNVLSRKGPQRLVDLCRLINVPASTLSELSDRLVADGLVTRRPNPEDRRSVVLDVTAAGRGRLDAVRQEAAAHLGAVLRRLDGESLEALLLGVRGLRDALADARAQSVDPGGADAPPD